MHKQDLNSPNQYDTGVALTGLSCFVTPDLARDLANDIMTLVSSFIFKTCLGLGRVPFLISVIIFIH